ncbi:hypothetical protein [Sphingomonas sp.]|uniref:hypothetical protein n=1 Tax=Sphingomonas sp. TaxID=28214 RepID=UPI0038A54513
MTAANASFLTAIAAFIAAAVALYVGFRNSEAAIKAARAALMNAENAGRHRIAAFRQDWINNVIETVSTHHSIEMTKNFASPDAMEDQRKLAFLRTKLEILLNPNETDTVELLNEMDQLRNSTGPKERTAHDAEIVRVARQLLKREWARIKTELA